MATPTWEETEEVKQPASAAPSWDETEPVSTGAEKTVGGFASNAVSDAGQIVGGVASLAGNMVTHPIDTTVSTIKGIPAAVKQLAKEWGVPEAMEGRFHDALKQIGNSVYEHPVSRALDIASVAVPALKGAGVLKGVDGAELANRAGKLGDAAEASASSRWAKAAGGSLRDAKELGGEEFNRLGRMAHEEGIVTPLNSTDSMVGKWDDLINGSADGKVRGTGPQLGDLRAKAEMYGDAPEASKLMQHLDQEFGPKYAEGIHQPESGAFANAKAEVQKLAPVDKLTASEELSGFMKEPPAEGVDSFTTTRRNPDYTPVPETLHVKNPIAKTLPPGIEKMPQWYQDQLLKDLAAGEEKISYKNPAFKDGSPTTTEAAEATRHPYEEFRAAQESPDYIPEIDIHRPTTFSEVGKVATKLNKFASGKSGLLQPNTAETDVANLVSKLNDEALLKAVPAEMGAEYTGALAKHSDLSKVGSFLDNKTAFEAGGSRNRISNNIVNRLQHKFGYQLTAEGMDRIAGFLKTNPEKFGKYASILNNAMTAGPAALATTVDLITQNDPRFAEQLGSMGGSSGQ